MKKLICLVLVLIMYGCMSPREAMDTWVGHSSQEIIETWGPPNKIVIDDKGGEIMVYAVPRVGPYNNYWQYRFMFLDKDHKIYHWVMRSDVIPPEQLKIEFHTTEGIY